jgi:Asp-tRNA(Asn)/Glu-tRNA(Gln) amidotransferase A subunit family amidase
MSVAVAPDDVILQRQVMHAMANHGDVVGIVAHHVRDAAWLEDAVNVEHRDVEPSAAKKHKRTRS